MSDKPLSTLTTLYLLGNSFQDVIEEERNKQMARAQAIIDKHRWMRVKPECEQQILAKQARRKTNDFRY